MTQMTLGDVGIRKAAAAGMVPEAVLSKITDDELRDRYAYAAQLTEQANRTGGREGARLIQKARAVMVAQPRAVTETAVRETVAKASALDNGRQADALRHQANALLEEHPPAPRREGSAAVTKATKAASGSGKSKPTMVAVYDAKGTLYAVVDQADLTLVEPQAAPPSPSEAKPAQAAAPAPAPSQPAGQADVVKAARRSVRRPRAEVRLDASGQMIGAVIDGTYKPVPPEVLAVAKERERVAKAAADRDLAAAAADPEFGRAVMTALPAQRREVVARWKASRPGPR